MLPQKIDYYDAPPWLEAMEWRRIAAEIPRIHRAFIALQYSPISKFKNKMLNTYQLADDGSCITADNSYEVIAQMRDGSRFASGDGFFDFMTGFAERYQLQTGNRVRVDSAENFIADLVRVGYLTEVTDGN